MTTLSFREKRDYSASKDGIEVPIVLRTGDAQAVRFMAKVDTGAEWCIFQRQHAEDLGIHVESGTPMVFNTTTGRFDAFGHTLLIECLAYEFEATVYFAADSAFPRSVVGRLGWLQHFRLALIDHDSTLYLSHYDD